MLSSFVDCERDEQVVHDRRDSKVSSRGAEAPNTSVFNL